MMGVQIAESGQLITNVIHQGDALTIAQCLPDECVQCIVTSPPYYGLRDYGVKGQIGLEETPEAYILRLVVLFRELRRVLRSDGVLWLNLGDSYANDGKWGGSTGVKHAGGLHGNTGIGRQRKTTGLAPKNRMMIPARVALALQADGWILRDEIVWAKNNVMPESVKDRTTKSHEMVYLLSKSTRYHFDQAAIREPADGYDGRKDTMQKGSPKYATNAVPGERPQTMAANGHERWKMNEHGERIRNRRSVWAINTEPTPFSHFATMPMSLVELCIKAGAGKDSLVYDPFMGSGTTALVAQKLVRRYLGSELNAEYVALARMRLAGRIEEYVAAEKGLPVTQYMFG